MKRTGPLLGVGIVVITALVALSVLFASASHSPAAGQIVGHCVGWPNPHVEIRWHSSPPPGSLPPNSNSVLRDVNGTGSAWFFSGGYPGVWGTRINGQPAAPFGPGGYPEPNYGVYDLRDDSVAPGNTYVYEVKYRPETTSSNIYSVTITEGNCGGTPTPPPVTPMPTPPPAGVIAGVCRWVNDEPEVQLTWSQYPPPGQGSADSNSVQKGDFYPGDDDQYWGFLNIDPSLYTYTDRDVDLNTQYQYRAKYRPDLPSLNIYNIFVSAENCGGPVSTSGPLAIAPTFQNVPPNVTAFLAATGGGGAYSWSAPEAILSGSGSQVAVTYTNDSTSPVEHTVSVTSGAQFATATVRVDGIDTLQDSIELLGRGMRFVAINDDDTYTNSLDVKLTLAHGFSPQASDSIAMQLSNTLEGLVAAPLQPYQKAAPWNLCDTPGYCSEGPYSVFVLYHAANGTVSQAVLDNILYLNNVAQGPPSVTINNGDVSTTDRLVALALTHGLANDIPIDEIGMQIANRADLVNAATPVPYAPFVLDWDLCAEIGPTCPNGPHTVFAKYCARGQCTAVVQDSIELNSLWPDWGVRINEDAAVTTSADVQLRLNPFFNRAGTEVLISNLKDLSDAATISFAPVVPWNLCLNRPGPCSADTFAVFVRYVNRFDPTLPGPESPRYEDTILLTLATPTPTPAAILIDDGAATTDTRLVDLTLSSPFGTVIGVSVRLINEQQLTERDHALIAAEYRGGIPSQPKAAVVTTNGTNPEQQPVQRLPTELESGTVRGFTRRVNNWDLCSGVPAEECLPGTYKVYAQFYRSPSNAGGGAPGALAALGDEVSLVYFDTIDYAAGTPAPSVTPSVSPTPSGSPGPGPGGPPVVLPPILSDLIRRLSEAEPLIATLAFASAVAVITSAIATILPLIGPGLLAFGWQSLMSLFGILPRRKKVWGTVYDSNTKRPIPYARVQLLDHNRRLLETRVADKDGRYGFLTTPESLQAQSLQIAILPSATGYTFPSKVAPGIDTFVYNNLYYGDIVTVNEKTLINFDIPMDPINPSTAPLLMKSPSIALGASVAALADAGFWLGLIMVPLSFILNPNPFTFGTLCLFLGTASLRLFGISEHPFGAVIDSQTGRAMPFALITLNDMSGRRVAFTVSDERGRYFLVAERGTYEISVFTSATVVPPRQSKTVLSAKKGWITRELEV